MTITVLLLLPGLLMANEVYFSPKGHIRDQILKRINHSRTSIDIAMYSLTSREIADALARAKERGVRVRVVRDLSQTSEKEDEDVVLEQAAIEVHILKGLGRGIMHDKFAVFDGQEGFTGSYNWTNNAEYDNYENAYFFNDPHIVQAYAREFEVLWAMEPIAAKERSARQPVGSLPFLRTHPAMSVFGLFFVLLALAAALST